MAEEVQTTPDITEAVTPAAAAVEEIGEFILQLQ